MSNYQTWSWYSPALQREMNVARWGHFGKPLLLFPTAGGDFLECERFLMIRFLEPLITAGRLKVYACGSISGETWLEATASPWHKSWLQARFDQYVAEELCPHISSDSNGYRPLACAGASLGAYNAVNTATKHPDWFDLCIAMSGTYYMDRWMGLHRDLNYYFNQPTQFVPNLPDGPVLTALRRSRFVLASGSGRAEAPGETVELGKILRARGVHADVEVWDENAHHDWPTWRTMLPLFLDRILD